MKKLFVIMFVVLFAATAAYADMTISGMYEAKGYWLENSTGYDEKANDKQWYDHELDADISFRPVEETFVNMNIEIRDEVWLESPAPNAIPAGGAGTDDTIAFKRLWGGHTFENGWKLETGLMTGGAFGHSFADNGDGYYRIKVTKASEEIGALLFIIEKRHEENSFADVTPGNPAEDDDSDAYYVAWVTKLGEANFGLLGGYIITGNTLPDGEEDSKTYLVDVYADGAAGQLGWEFEFQYKTTSLDSKFSPAEDPTVYGAMVNVWINPAPLKAGVLLAYASFDDDAQSAFSMGVDPDYMLIWDGEYGFGGASDDIAGATFAKVYVDYAVSETVSLNGAFSFLDSNQEGKGAVTNAWEDASGYEINVGGKVKITDNVAWDFGLGYGQLDREDPTTPLVKEDPDATTKFYHRIKYTF